MIQEPNNIGQLRVVSAAVLLVAIESQGVTVKHAASYNGAVARYCLTGLIASRGPGNIAFMLTVAATALREENGDGIETGHQDSNYFYGDCRLSHFEIDMAAGNSGRIVSDAALAHYCNGHRYSARYYTSSSLAQFTRAKPGLPILRQARDTTFLGRHNGRRDHDPAPIYQCSFLVDRALNEWELADVDLATVGVTYKF